MRIYSLLFIISLIYCNSMCCQSSIEYYNRYIEYNCLIEEARTYKKNRQPINAINKYKSAISIYEKKFRDGKYFDLAICYATLGNIDSAIFYLRHCFNQNSFFCDLIEKNPEFSNLKKDSISWQLLMDECKQGEVNSNKILDTALARTINAIAITDQKYRKLLNEKSKEKDLDSLMARQLSIDKENEKIMQDIIATNGWPTYKLVGIQAAHNCWLIIQHSSDKFQKYCLPLLEEAVKNNQASVIDYAYLYDRICISEKKEQLYGTQILMNEKGASFWPIKDEYFVDSRREKIGLLPIFYPALEFGIDYNYKK